MKSNPNLSLMKKNIYLILFLSLFLAAIDSQAQEIVEVVEIAEAEEYVDSVESRPVTGYYSVEIGGSSVLATYLSPLKYTGKNIGVSGFWTKALPFNPQHAVMNFKGDANLSSLMNPAKTASMIGMFFDFSWGMEWRTKLPCDIQVSAGGAVQIAGGLYYLLRNSNNPVETIANLSLDISASLSKSFRIGRLPILVSDRIQIPSLGIFFSAEYGETYYEIYLGNRKGLVHPGWWGNNFRIDNLLSFTLDFGRTAMSLGYRIYAYNQWANNLNTKVVTNSFVIGVVPGGIGLKNKPKNLPENKIYAIY